MTQTTDWNALIIPVREEISHEDFDEWGGILTDVFEGQIDEKLIPAGPLNDRPAPNPSETDEIRRWIVTDNNPPYLSLEFAGGWTTLGGESVNQNDFAYNRNTFGIVTSSYPTDQYIKIARISDGSSEEKGAFRAYTTNSVDAGNAFSQTKHLQMSCNSSSFTARNWIEGQDATTELDYVITETSGTGSNSQNEYYLYIDPATTSDSVLVIETTTNFGEFDFTSGITTSELTGSIVYDTNTQAPDEQLQLGSLAGELTNNEVLDSIAGDNLSIDNNILNAIGHSLTVQDDGTDVTTDTDIINFDANITATKESQGTVSVDSTASGGTGGGTKTTLFMSDYVPAGSRDGSTNVDTEFETAVSEANPDDTIVFDDGIYQFGSSHTLTKPLTLDSSDGKLQYTNSTNNNAMFLFQGNGRTDNTNISEGLTIGERVVSVGSTTAFSAGDAVLLLNGTYSSNINTQAQFDRITSVGSGTVTLDGGCSYEFPSGSTLYRVELLQNATMRNLNVSGGNRQLQFRWCENPTFEDCTVNDYLEVSLYSLDCWKPRYYGVEARKPQGKAGGEGEPVALYRCSDGYIESPRIYECRRGIDFAWGTHDVTIQDPVIRGVDLVGIGIHQNDIGGKFSIFGGSIICDSQAFTGNCIAFSDSATLNVEGTYLAPYQNGIIASGETHVTDVTVEPVTTTSSDPGLSGINVTGPTVVCDNIRVIDPTGELQFPIYVNPSGTTVEFCKIDFFVESPNNNAIHVDAQDSGDVVNYLELDGEMDGLGSADPAMFTRSDNGTLSFMDASLTFKNITGQGIRVFNSSGTTGNLDFHNCYMDTGQAAIYTDGTGSFGAIRVSDSTFDTGGTSLSFNETIDKLIITSNDVSGSIDSSGATESVVQHNI